MSVDVSAVPAPLDELPDEATLLDVGPWARLRAYLATPEPEPEPADSSPDRIPNPTPPRQGDDPINAPRAIRRLLDSDLVQRVAGLRTPGGLFPLVVFILFMLFAIVPVNSNGDTRLLLLWRALTGGAFLPLSAAHQRRLAEQSRIQGDNAAFASAEQAAGKVASAAAQVVNDAGVTVTAGQVGWDVFWATAGSQLQILTGQG